MAGRMIINLSPYEVIHKSVFYPAGRGYLLPPKLGYYYLVAPHMYDPSRGDLIVVGATSFDENGFSIDEK
jgi:hypothetical protein